MDYIKGERAVNSKLTAQFNQTYGARLDGSIPIHQLLFPTGLFTSDDSLQGKLSKVHPAIKSIYNNYVNWVKRKGVKNLSELREKDYNFFIQRSAPGSGGARADFLFNAFKPLSPK